MAAEGYRSVGLTDILFFDIETVSGQPHFDHLSDKMKAHWEKKYSSLRNVDEDFVNGYAERAAIYAEFGKVVCISAGFLTMDEGRRRFRVKSFYGEEERILADFSALLRSSFSNRRNRLCGHNIKEFDVPYLCRRMLVHGLPLPPLLDIPGLKPWETQFLDTMNLWKFGDYKAFTSLDLLTAIFDVPTPKDDMEGSMVGYAYWHDKDIERIVSYCEKDVVAVANVFFRMRGEAMLSDNEVVMVDKQQ